MQYTQLDFAPYSPRRLTLEEQAGLLVREIVLGRTHPFPCTCGACVADQLGAGTKPGSRRFSKRTVLLHFIRANMFTAALVEFISLPLKKRGEMLKDLAADRRYDGAQKKCLAEGRSFDPMKKGWHKDEPAILSTDVFPDWLRQRARARALEMIRALARRERRRDVKEFLAGFLVGRSFYTYYKRAGSPELEARVKAVRDLLLATTDRPLSPACPHRRRGRKRHGPGPRRRCT